MSKTGHGMKKKFFQNVYQIPIWDIQHCIFLRKKYLLKTFHLDPQYTHTQQVRPRTYKTISLSFFVPTVTFPFSILAPNVPALFFDILLNEL